MNKRHLIIGSSAASIGVLSKLRKLAPHDEIICLTAQEEMPYNTCLLADYLSEGIPPSTLMTKSAEFFATNNITLHRGTTVERIDRAEKKVWCSGDISFDYDTLFIGTGTTQRWLPMSSPAKSGLFGFQTLHDANGLHTFVNDEKPKTALVIGAGLSGVECADALTERGVNVTILEYGPHILPTLINTNAAPAIVQRMQAAGTTVHTGMGVSEITVDANGRASGVITTNQTTLTADMVVVAIGATANTQLAADAGLTITNGGIQVDEFMTTNDPAIFAGGDVASVPTRNGEEHVRSCTWPDAAQQGMFAASAMAGQPKPYPGVTIVLSSHFYGTRFVSCGPVVTPPSEYECIEKKGDGWYQMFILDGAVLKGFILVEKLEHIGVLRRLVTTGDAIDRKLLQVD